MGQLTEEELIEAYKQINIARDKNRDLAQKAATLIEKKCGKGFSVIVTKPEWASHLRRNNIPYLPEYYLGISYSQYDIFNDWLKQKISEQKTRPISRINLMGNDREGFELELGKEDGFPDKTSYWCFLSGYNAHASGF